MKKANIIFLIAGAICMPHLSAEDGVKPEAPVEVKGEGEKTAVREISKGIYQVGEVTINAAKKEVSFGVVFEVVGEDNLEYVLVNESGEKIHESLLVTGARPVDLNVAMLLCFKPFPGFIPTDEVRRKQAEEGLFEKPGLLPKRKVPLSAVLELDVIYQGVDGREVICPVEDLIWNAKHQATEKGREWIFTGSNVDPEIGFVAQATGSVMALMEDPLAMINNPRPEAPIHDDVWFPVRDAKKIPAKGTEARLVIRLSPAKGKETEKSL